MMKGKVVPINHGLVVKFLGLLNNFGATQVPGFVVDEWGSQVSHISGSNTLTTEGWSDTKFLGIYIPMIYAILWAIVF